MPRISKLNVGCEAFAIFCSTTESVSVDFLSQGWGHLITWNGPMMGHFNSFSASGSGELWKKNIPNYSGGLPGGGGGGWGMFKLQFDWYIILSWNQSWLTLSNFLHFVYIRDYFNCTGLCFEGISTTNNKTSLIKHLMIKCSWTSIMWLLLIGLGNKIAIEWTVMKPLSNITKCNSSSLIWFNYQNNVLLIKPGIKLVSMPGSLCCVWSWKHNSMSTQMRSRMPKLTRSTIFSYVMACVCSCSNWLNFKNLSSVMPTGRLRVHKNKTKSHIVINLLTSNIRSLRENLKPWPCCSDLTIAWSVQ